MKMIALLTAGLGLCVVGLLAIALGVPISETSFGNALLIAGVLFLCTGLILTGMWLAARELIKAFTQPGSRPAARPGELPKASIPSNPFDQSLDHLGARSKDNDQSAEPNSEIPNDPPPWANEAASRDRARLRPSAPEIPPPVEAPPVPERPARRNLLFSTKRRDKPDSLVPVSSTPVPMPALEAEPKVSFENAWPQSPRSNGSGTERTPGETMVPNSGAGADSSGTTSSGAADAPAAPENTADDSSGAAIIKSGVVDGMSYSLYSDGSIEAKLPGEGPIRFASLDALRTYLDQRQ